MALLGKLGSVESVRSYLNGREFVSYLDWHRLGSDLDILFFSDSNQRIDAKVSDKVRKVVADTFPPNSFYKTMDVIFATDFFAKHPPQSEHFEAISNLPISIHGFQHLPELKVPVNGRQVDLVDWGVRQYLSQSFDFELNHEALQKMDGYANARQLLRWIRYVAAEPRISITPNGFKAMLDLRDFIFSGQKTQIVQMLKSSASRQKDKAAYLGSKLIEAPAAGQSVPVMATSNCSIHNMFMNAA